ncbi:hypothetical protein [Conyzicola sp.]|uniref:hypothetical protein n=1 Tax=Conyzicola sp. TaxID=1969404 RepID=UPI003988E7E7
MAPLSLFLISLAVVAVAVPQQTELSPFDEYVYIDYLAKVPDQLVLHQGEETGEYARDQLDCRGVIILGPTPVNCGPATTVPPQDGLTSADIYSPTYFAITRVFAQPLVWTGVGLVDAGRLAGGIWLGLGAVLLFFLMTRLWVPRMLAWGLAVIVIISPASHWSNTYVSTDAPSLAAGAAVSLLGVLVYQRKRHPAWLAVAAALVVLLKFQNIISVALVAIVLVVFGVKQAYAEAGNDRRQLLAGIARSRPVRVAVVVLLVSLVTQLAWMIVRSAISYGPSPVQGVDVPLTKTELLLQAFNFLRFTPLGFTESLDSPIPLVVGIILVTITTAGVIGMIFTAKAGSPKAIIAGSTLFASMASAPVLAVVVYLIVGEYAELRPRYGQSLLAAFVLCGGWLLAQRKWSSPVVAGGAALLLVASLVTS